MRLTGFQVQMYKCVINSGWIEVEPLTVLVGKNESGKTSLLRAIHKFNLFVPEPYSIPREWPRGHRGERTEAEVVCIAEFELSAQERRELQETTGEAEFPARLRITKDYAGRFEVQFPESVAPEELHPNDIDAILESLPEPAKEVGPEFRNVAQECRAEATRIAHEGRFSALGDLARQHKPRLESVRSPGNPQPQHNNEGQFISSFLAKLQEVTHALEKAPSIQRKAHDYVIGHLPTFVYMDEYRVFAGSAMLDQVQQRRALTKQSKSGGLTEEDKTVLTLFALSGLDIDEQVRQGTAADREERQYDLDDAAATLTKLVEDHWGQLRYEVRYGADGQQFFTFVKDPKDRALIRLEERSRGFQWFFSFDLRLMHETRGTLKGCVILLDEPGLHLHPEGQQDLLRRFAEYAEGNGLIYSSHLPFMIDLEHPERIRIISETEEGARVSKDFTTSQAEGKLTLQAALGISGRTSFLVAAQNLVVEGVDDYWILAAISNLLKRCGEEGMPEYIMVTPAGGASEVTYIATFMTGQELDVVALYDTDTAGNVAKDALQKKWLTRFSGKGKTTALSLGPTLGIDNREFSIEDLFPEEFYLKYVNSYYERQLIGAGSHPLTLVPGGQICKRVEDRLAQLNIKFNKGSIAKRMCHDINRMRALDQLPSTICDHGRRLFRAITTVLPE